MCRLFGLTPVIWTVCSEPSSLHVFPGLHYINYMSPALILALVWLLATDCRLWLSTPVRLAFKIQSTNPLLYYAHYWMQKNNLFCQFLLNVVMPLDIFIFQFKLWQKYDRYFLPIQDHTHSPPFFIKMVKGDHHQGYEEHGRTEPPEVRQRACVLSLVISIITISSKTCP